MKRISQVKLAKLAGVSQPYINKLIKQGILPLHEGYLDEDECITILRNKSHDQSTNNQEYAEFDRQYKKARAVKEARVAEIRGIDLKIKQLNVDIQNGNVVLKENLSNYFCDFLIRFRQDLYNMPNRLAVSCTGRNPDQISQIIQSEVNYTQQSIKEFLESFRALLVIKQ